MATLLNQVQFSLLEKLCELRPIDEKAHPGMYVSQSSSVESDSDTKREDPHYIHKERQFCEYTLSKQPRTGSSEFNAAIAAANINSSIMHQSFDSAVNH